MLEVAQTNSQGRMPLLTNTESRTHFGMWAIVSSPLILGFDLTNASLVDQVWPYVTNREVIAVNQQYTTFSGSVFYSAPTNVTFQPCGWWLDVCSFPSSVYLYKPQPNNTMAIMLVNNKEHPDDLSVTFSAIPRLVQAAEYHVRDLWGRRNLGKFKTELYVAGVASHDSVFVLLTPV
eukprot:PhF_6_TR6992/c0_g2_i1/m.10373/K07407/E3.2.1.22B, galA, rafA; alpha-galactosidase